MSGSAKLTGSTQLSPSQDRLDAFERLLLVRCFREDRTLLSAIDYIKTTLGPQYSEAQQLDLGAVVEECSCTMPVIFLLSQGSDPTATIEALAKKRKKRISAISMGQGQVWGGAGCRAPYYMT